MYNAALQGEMHITIHSERAVIADCLSDLGLHECAKKVIKLNTSQELIKKFLNIIEKEATKLERHDVLERLYFSGLIYG